MLPDRILCVLVLLLLVMSCNGLPFEEVEQDWSERQATQVSRSRADLRFAVATMLSPQETARDYQSLVQGLGRELGQRIDVVYRKTYEEVNRLLLQKKLDLAFVCTGGYLELVRAAPTTPILVVPMVNGKTTYRSFIIVRSGYRARSFADLRGARFVFTDPLSHTGYFYPISLIKDLGDSEPGFFSSNAFAASHDRSIHSVQRGVYDAGAVDSLVYEHLARHRPDRVRGLRVLQASPEFGIPPIIASPHIPEQERGRWRSALLELHRRAEMSQTFQRLGIERFVVPPPDLYRTARELWLRVRQ